MGEEIAPDQSLYAERDAERNARILSGAFARITKARNALMVEIASGLRAGLALDEILDQLGLKGNAMAKNMIRVVTKQTTPEQLADAIDEARRSWE